MASPPPTSTQEPGAVGAGGDALTLAGHTFSSRLIVGTGKYADNDTMRRAIAASGAEVVTVAVRRERLFNDRGESLLDALDLDALTILPNTAGCFSAEDAVRVARLGRELLEQLGNPGAGWVKLEVLGDKRTLLPDPTGTLEACRELVADGFQVLCYTSDDPISAVDALLTLQEVPDGSQGRSKGLARAQDMLAALEDVRRGLLLGAIPRAKLEALARLARTRREVFQDPRLTEILDEIELRAEVELAKLER